MLWMFVGIAVLVLAFCFVIGGVDGKGGPFSWKRGLIFTGACFVILILSGLITWAVQGE